MAGYWQIGVAETYTCQMFLESGLKGSFRLTNIQQATLVAGHHIHHIAQLAMERPAYSETGAMALHLLVRVQERASSTTGITTWVGAGARVSNVGPVSLERTSLSLRFNILL